MRALAFGAALLGLTGWARVEAQQAGGPLESCLQAALGQKPGDIVKLEILTAGESTEAGQPAPGTRLYEIETRGPDGKEWELTCDMKTGRIIEVEQEVPDANDPAFKAKAKVSEAEARKTVLAAHGGEIVEVEYEIEASGAASYEFDLNSRSGTGELKMEVDATSGKMVEHREEHYQIGVEPSAEADE
jgi:uncharacterized membrane protein YkoI